MAPELPTTYGSGPRRRSGRSVCTSIVSLASFVAMGGCAHESPFTYTPPTSQGPFAPGNPLRLTFNPDVDERPTWLPGDTLVLYSEQPSDVHQPERCLATISAGGGVIIASRCPPFLHTLDSTIALEPGEVASDWRLLYLRNSIRRGIGAGPSVAGDIRSVSLTTGQAEQVVWTYPYLSPTGRSIDIASNIRWAGAKTAVFVAEHWFVVQCLGCVPDTVRWGLEIDRVDFSGTQPTISVLPNTDDASSLAMAGNDTLYFTVNGDSRIHRRLLSAGTEDVVFDFGVGIARDVSVGSGYLAAVVGGQVTFQFDTAYQDSIQIDHGGVLHVLKGGQDLTLSDTTVVVRRPALSATGGLLVAEVRPSSPLGPPTGPLIPTDLWVWQLH